MVAPEVVLVEVVNRPDLAGQKAAPEGAVGDEADAELPQGGQDLDLRVAAPQRVLGLQCGYAMSLVGAADRRRRGLGQPEVAHLACLDESGHRPNRFLDRSLAVDPVLVVEI